MARTIHDIAEALRQRKDGKTRCTLLVGAGCSLTAGIPLAGQIVEDIRARHPHTYTRALSRAQRRDAAVTAPQYGDCMAELDPGPQRDLIRGYIDRALVNWAHVGIGALIRHGYVDRVLTTNFDPLIARGCAVFNEFPAVYDLTMSHVVRFEDLPEKAVFHLHGQRNGFSLLNDPGELAQHRQRVEPLFRHAREGRVWIVCGYSGLNDPLFELIRQCQRYEYALYWIGHDREPAPHLKALMDDPDRTRCHYLHYAGADRFFLNLANALGHFPFEFMDKPLDHMAMVLDGFADFPTDMGGGDLLTDARARIREYQARIDANPPQKSPDQAVLEAIAAQSADQLQQVGEEVRRRKLRISPAVSAQLSMERGDRCLDEAIEASEGDAERNALLKAIDWYGQAARLAPEQHEPWRKWALALSFLAEVSDGHEERFIDAAVALHEALGEPSGADADALVLASVALARVGGAMPRGVEAARLLDIAYGFAREAHRRGPGSGAYQAARVQAVRGDHASMVDWLGIAFHPRAFLEREIVLDDSAFEAARETPEFKAWWSTADLSA